MEKPHLGSAGPGGGFGTSDCGVGGGAVCVRSEGRCCGSRFKLFGGMAKITLALLSRSIKQVDRLCSTSYR